MKNMLIVDDEKAIIQTIKTYFEDNEFNVLTATSAKSAEEQLHHLPDIVLLDIMMPGLDGINFCREVREKVACPIIFLSAKTDVHTKIESLAAGGDDYITKPFSMRELHARVDAHLRREARPRNTNSRIYFGDFWIDGNSKQSGVENSIIDFTKKEYLIIEYLSSHPNQVFSHERIYEAVWGYDAEGDANTAIAEHIKRIRKKLQVFDCDKLIETVWGIGYRWKR